MKVLRVIAVGAVVPVMFAGSTPSAHPDRTTGVSSATASPVVGEVTAVAGTKALFLSDGGDKEKLRKGDKLHLDDVVLAGKGVRATLEVHRPSDVSADTELISVKPVGTTKHLMRLHREGRITFVKIES